MAQVAVTINGRNYRIACEDGQEDHLAGLANYLDQKVGELVHEVGQIGDTRLLVMASLLIADELSDTRTELAEALRGGGQPGDAGTAEAESAVAARLEAFAKRIDSIAASLDRT